MTLNFPFFRNYLIKNMMNNYDDEVKIFLISCLRKISYLKDVKGEVLNFLANNMIAMQVDRGGEMHSV